MNHFIEKEDFEVFVGILIKKFELISTKRKDGIIIFDPIKDFSEIDLSKNSFYSPKKVIFPEYETLFSYEKQKGLFGMKREVIRSEYPTKKQVILGMRMCDVSGIRKLADFFSKDVADPFVSQRLENTYIIAKKCDHEENDNCFCSSFPVVDQGYDLFMQAVKGGYLVHAKTRKGRELIRYGKFTRTDREAKKSIPRCLKHIDKQDLDPKSVALKMPGWESESRKCLSCAACNIVCPTCSCYDIRDTPNLDLKSGARQRRWSFCQTAEYSRVAGGHIFRDQRNSRFAHRLLCKFTYMPDNYGEITCTGCGRCITVCPTQVCDIPKMLSSKKNGAVKKIGTPIAGLSQDQGRISRKQKITSVKKPVAKKPAKKPLKKKPAIRSGPKKAAMAIPGKKKVEAVR